MTIPSTIEATLATTDAPCAVHATARLTARTRTTSTGTLSSPASNSAAARGRGSAPTTAKRRGSSGSTDAVTGGAIAKPSVTAEPASTVTTAVVSRFASARATTLMTAKTVPATSTNSPTARRRT
ncbi:hypothetical protein SRABI128_01881 [Microbacterium sp. Bi128]|nr:hypothetical protein SRABI128_01881 [Microbacterium sp. Bi128]